MPTLKVLKAVLANKISIRDKDLGVFNKRMAEDPFYAFEWADSAMASVAHAKVAQHYLNSIKLWEELNQAGTLSEQQPQTEEAVVEFIRESVFHAALRMASSPRRSTSQASNFMATEEAAAYADLAASWDNMYD